MSWTFYRDALAISFVLFFGAVLVGWPIVVSLHGNAMIEGDLARDRIRTMGSIGSAEPEM